MLAVHCLGVIWGCSRRTDAHCRWGSLHSDRPTQPINPVRAAARGGIRSVLRLCLHCQLRPAPDPPQAAWLYPLYWLVVTLNPLSPTKTHISSFYNIVFSTFRRWIPAPARSFVWVSAVLPSNRPETRRTRHSADRYSPKILIWIVSWGLISGLISNRQCLDFL